MPTNVSALTRNVRPNKGVNTMGRPKKPLKEKCVHCGARKLEADMLYVVALDEYFCGQEHFDEHYPEKGD